MFGEIELPDLSTAMDWPAVQMTLPFGEATPVAPAADPAPEIASVPPPAPAAAPATVDPAPVDPGPADPAPADPPLLAPIVATEPDAPVFSDPPAVAPVIDLAAFGDNGFDDAVVAAIGRSLIEANLFF